MSTALGAIALAVLPWAMLVLVIGIVAVASLCFGMERRRHALEVLRQLTDLVRVLRGS